MQRRERGEEVSAETEVAGTGDSGHWKVVAEDGKDSSKPPAAPSSWSAPALQRFPVHVEVSMSS